ncbi:MAG: hypothetical protein GX568_10500 [Candidatus Gastranaerophilales bacterium]|nr:hypothetical protein [Candidatus Gastranaerophilales bacterium]
MDREQAVKIILEKRFGDVSPENIPNLLEINTFVSDDNDESAMGIGVQLVISEGESVINEEYQVNPDGIVFSWGNTPVIDDRSLKHRF